MNRLCILIPVYNNQQGLDRTLLSLYKAEGEFDILVVDDGSDEPIAIQVEGEAKRRTCLFRMKTNGGITRALNAGLQLCRELGYEFIGRVDSSDTVDASRLRMQMDYLLDHPQCGIVGSYIEFTNFEGETLFEYRAPTSHSGILRRMRSENCLIHSGVTMRASVVAEVGGYRESCLTGEDYDMFLRMIRVAEAAILPLPLTRCEYNLAGISIARRRRQQRERLSLQFQYFQLLDWASYYGIVRTLAALLTPHGPVLRFKRAVFGPVV